MKTQDQIRSKNQVLKRLLEIWSVELNPSQPTNSISKLAALVNTTAPDGLWEKALEKWLMASISNLLIDNFSTNRTCLVLAGDNASAFFKALWPKGQEEYAFQGWLEAEHKDCHYLMASTFFMNIEEPFPTSSEEKGFNHFKRLLTLDRVNFRPHYAKFNIGLPRVANFCGSLPSTLGLYLQTRYIQVFELLQPIDLSALEEFDMTKVWGEAYRLLRAGKNYLWQSKELEELESYQKRFKYGQQGSFEKNVLLKRFKIATEEEHQFCLTTMQLLRRLEKDYANLSPAQLELELNRLGCPFKFKKKEEAKGWFLTPIAQNHKRKRGQS